MTEYRITAVIAGKPVTIDFDDYDLAFRLTHAIGEIKAASSVHIFKRDKSTRSYVPAEDWEENLL